MNTFVKITEYTVLPLFAVLFGFLTLYEGLSFSFSENNSKTKTRTVVIGVLVILIMTLLYLHLTFDTNKNLYFHYCVNGDGQPLSAFTSICCYMLLLGVISLSLSASLFALVCVSWWLGLAWVMILLSPLIFIFSKLCPKLGNKILNYFEKLSSYITKKETYNFLTKLGLDFESLIGLLMISGFFMSLIMIVFQCSNYMIII